MGIEAPYPPSPYPPKGPYEVTLLQPSLNSEHRVLELRLPFICGGLSESKMSGHGLSLTKSFWEAGHYCAFKFHLGGVSCRSLGQQPLPLSGKYAAFDRGDY